MDDTDTLGRKELYDEAEARHVEGYIQVACNF